MSFFAYVTEHSSEILTEMLVILSSSGMAFLSALLVNSAIDRRTERKSFHSMLACLRAEADSNVLVLETGFVRYSKEGIVNQRFSTATSRQYLAIPTFVKHAAQQHIETLGRYIRRLELSNAYADEVRTLRFQTGQGEAEREQWIGDIEGVWQPNIQECEQSIKEVCRLE
jgi:hypothetical protein